VPRTNIFSLATSVGIQPAVSRGNIEAETLPAASKRSHIIWAEGKLWYDYVLTRQTHYAIGEFGGGGRIVNDTYLAAFNLKSGLSEAVQIPERFFSLSEWEGGLPEYAVFRRRLVFFFPDQAVIYDRTTKEFSTIPAPLTSPHVLQLGERLLLYNAETILETTGDLKDFKVLASVRRRPALTELDTLTTLDPIQLRLVGTNGLLVLANGRAYISEGGQWRSVLAKDSANFTLKPGGGESVFIDQRMGESLVYEDVSVGRNTNVYRAYYFGLGAEQGELWWSGMVVPSLTSPLQQKVVSDSSGASSKYTSLPATVPFFWLSGRGFDGTVMACFPFQGRLFSVSFPPNNHSEISLYFWSPDRRDPVIISVSLPGRSLNGNVVPNNQLIIAGENIFVWSPAISGIWRIDGAQLLSRLESALTTGNPSHDAIHAAP
jgi:hypothetical protein